jgi:hypothetical protein
MNFHIKTILLLVLSCVLTLTIVRVAKAEYPKCGLYEPYRCVPTYGNKVQCGCGL